MSRQPPEKRTRRPPPGSPARQPDSGWRWVVIVVVGLLVATVVLPPLLGGSSKKSLAYDAYIQQVDAGRVQTADVDTANGHISGKFTDGSFYAGTRTQPAS